MLKFSQANAKTKQLAQIRGIKNYLKNKKKIYSLDLSSGWTCPGAKDCLAKVIEIGQKHKIQDGPHCLFRCFSASQEVLFPAVYNSRKHNTNTIKAAKTTSQILALLEGSMPPNLGILRWHVAGDFFKLAYLKAAYLLAQRHPDRLFYAYTKSLHHLSKLDCLNLSKGQILPNFLVTASRGGKYDHLIEGLGIREAKVILAENKAGKLPIDHTDEHAARSGGSFALLIHGVQPKGSKAATALKALKGKGTYNRKK